MRLVDRWCRLKAGQAQDLPVQELRCWWGAILAVFSLKFESLKFKVTPAAAMSASQLFYLPLTLTLSLKGRGDLGVLFDGWVVDI